jgi:hypothetical protein
LKQQSGNNEPAQAERRSHAAGAGVDHDICAADLNRDVTGRISTRWVRRGGFDAAGFADINPPCSSCESKTRRGLPPGRKSSVCISRIAGSDRFVKRAIDRAMKQLRDSVFGSGGCPACRGVYHRAAVCADPLAHACYGSCYGSCYSSCVPERCPPRLARRHSSNSF